MIQPENIRTRCMQVSSDVLGAAAHIAHPPSHGRCGKSLEELTVKWLVLQLAENMFRILLREPVVIVANRVCCRIAHILDLSNNRR